VTSWEFRYLSLFAGEFFAGGSQGGSPEQLAQARAEGEAAIARQKETIAQLGSEGWEPVGVVEFSWRRTYEANQVYRELMLKRQND